MVVVDERGFTLDLIDQEQDEIMDFMEDIEKEIRIAIDDANRAAQSEMNKINTAGWLNALSFTGGLKKSVERKTEIRLYFPKFKKSIEISAAMLVPDVALAVKMVNPSWKNEGKFDVRIALYFLNLTAGSLDFGCVQMGDNWNKTPTFTFQGGCDNEWNLGGPEDPITGKQL